MKNINTGILFIPSPRKTKRAKTTIAGISLKSNLFYY
jgi:hypothetical protein